METRPTVVNPARRYRELIGLGERAQEEDARLVETRGEWFDHGMIAMGLELESHARIFEDVRGIAVDDTIRLTVASSLRSILDMLGMRALVDDELDRIVREAGVDEEHARRAAAEAEAWEITLIPESWHGLSSLPRATVVAVVPSPQGDLLFPLPPSFDAAQEELHLSDTGALHRVDRTTGRLLGIVDPVPTMESASAADAEERRSHAQSTADQETQVLDAGTLDEVEPSGYPTPPNVVEPPSPQEVTKKRPKKKT